MQPGVYPLPLCHDNLCQPSPLIHQNSHSPESVMSTALEFGLPSTRHLQHCIRDKTTIEVKVTTGDVITGTLKWQDPDCLSVEAAGGVVLIWRQAIVYLKPNA